MGSAASGHSAAPFELREHRQGLPESASRVSLGVSVACSSWAGTQCRAMPRHAFSGSVHRSEHLPGHKSEHPWL
eukprot:9827425-Alexandrium_andersonii.AAC.1